MATARAEAEIEFRLAYRRIIRSNDTDSLEKVEKSLLRYTYTMFFAFAREVTNSTSSSWAVYGDIDHMMKAIIDDAFHQMHPRSGHQRWEFSRASFSSLARLHIQSSDAWILLQRALVKKAKAELKSRRKQPPASANPPSKRRFNDTIISLLAAQRMEDFLDSNSIGLTDFASKIGITDRTLRSFRKSGKIRRESFEKIAKEMGTTKEHLLQPGR